MSDGVVYDLLGLFVTGTISSKPTEILSFNTLRFFTSNPTPNTKRANRVQRRFYGPRSKSVVRNATSDFTRREEFSLWIQTCNLKVSFLGCITVGTKSLVEILKLSLRANTRLAFTLQKRYGGSPPTHLPSVDIPHTALQRFAARHHLRASMKRTRVIGVWGDLRGTFQRSYFTLRIVALNGRLAPLTVRHARFHPTLRLTVIR
ncbi:hypothetical protein E4U32_006689 [Claviceps aff. humidiphila group G2b]|nr:hypothetical protein E4U32_006689 [Claviceps aff. humidiphila group G2b]